MPIYEYRCIKCKHQFEIMQDINAEVLRKCPECKKKFLERLISLSSFRLKGTGWYAPSKSD